MKKNIWIPATIGLILLALLLTMAFTELFQPIIAFIHNREITPIQAASCIMAAVLGFFIVYKVLTKLGEYFLPEE